MHRTSMGWIGLLARILSLAAGVILGIITLDGVALADGQSATGALTRPVTAGLAATGAVTAHIGEIGATPGSSAIATVDLGASPPATTSGGGQPFAARIGTTVSAHEPTVVAGTTTVTASGTAQTSSGAGLTSTGTVQTNAGTGRTNGDAVQVNIDAGMSSRPTPVNALASGSSTPTNASSAGTTVGAGVSVAIGGTVQQTNIQTNTTNSVTSTVREDASVPSISASLHAAVAPAPITGTKEESSGSPPGVRVSAAVQGAAPPLDHGAPSTSAATGLHSTVSLEPGAAPRAGPGTRTGTAESHRGVSAGPERLDVPAAPSVKLGAAPAGCDCDTGVSPGAIARPAAPGASPATAIPLPAASGSGPLAPPPASDLDVVPGSARGALGLGPGPAAGTGCIAPWKGATITILFDLGPIRDPAFASASGVAIAAPALFDLKVEAAPALDRRDSRAESIPAPGCLPPAAQRCAGVENVLGSIRVR